MLNSPKYPDINKKFLLSPNARSISALSHPLPYNSDQLNKIQNQNYNSISNKTPTSRFFSAIQNNPNKSRKNNIDTNNTTFNSTGFSFYKNNNKKKLLERNFSQKIQRNNNFNLNYNLPKFSVSFFDDIYTPQEENKKIQSILSKINTWDIDHISQIKESLKSAQTFCRARRKSIEIQKQIENYGHQSIFDKLKPKKIFTRTGKFKFSAFNNISLEKLNKRGLEQENKKNNSMIGIGVKEKNNNNNNRNESSNKKK